MKFAFSAIALIFLNLCYSQTQIGQDIDGASSENSFGHSVSLSSDGSILAIGGYRNAKNGSWSGYVQVFQEINNKWVQLGQDINGDGIDHQLGYSVSLNANGNILAIGAISGSAKVYQNQNGRWVQIGSTLYGGSSDNFGNSVSLNSKGDILAIGAPADTNYKGTNAGSTRVYKNVNGNWRQIGSTIYGGEGNHDRFGHSVCLNNDGTILAVGAIQNFAPGFVKIFENQNNSWVQLGSNIVGQSQGDNCGFSIDLSSNGTTVAIGSDNANNGAGHVRIFEYLSNTWRQIDNTIIGENSGDGSGISISLNDEGDILAIGATGNSDESPGSGHARVFKNQRDTWEQIGEDINGEGAIDRSGRSVSLNAEGLILAIGAPFNDGVNGEESGHVRVYNLESVLVTPVFDSIVSICKGNTLNPLPTTSNNGITGIWSPALDNTLTQTYTFTPDLGQSAIATTLTIEVNEPISPEFDPIAPICPNETINPLPTTSNNGITGVWSPALDNTKTTTYLFTPSSSGCIATTELEIKVREIDELKIVLEVLSAPFSDSGSIKANVSGGSGNYEYQLDNGLWVRSNVINDLTSCDQYTVSVRDIDACNTQASASIQMLNYPKFFTPNGDGTNERWNIRCLNHQPLARIYIYDRYGKLLNKISPSGMGWDGTYNGKALPSNDYWFVAEYLDDFKLKKTFKSHFTLKR